MNNQRFYLRQLAHLISQGVETESALREISELTRAWHPVLQHFQKTQDLLGSLGLINDNNVSSFLESLKEGRELGISDEQLLKNSMSSVSSTLQINTIVKSRLVRSLGYSALVAIIALIVLTIFLLYILPVYQEVIYDQMTQSAALTTNIDALTLKSWKSLLIYLPPVIIIAIFLLIFFTPINKLSQNPLLSMTPVMKDLAKQSARVHFIHRLNSYYDFLSDYQDIAKTQLESAFFSGSSRWNSTRLFNTQEQEAILALHKLGTFKQESGNLTTQIESDAIETISNRTSNLATAFHIVIIIIVAQIVLSIYQPIFQLGAGF